MKKTPPKILVQSGKIKKFFPSDTLNQGTYVVNGEETAHHKAELQRYFDRKDKKV